MSVRTTDNLPTLNLAALYEADETAWLDATADLIRRGRTDELDLPHLAEFLEDMARRDRREVESRLSVLIGHLLKWRFQPERRSRSWRVTVETQRQELEADFESGTLRNHAADFLPKAYRKAVRLAAAETALDESAFPEACPYTLDEILSFDVLAE
jgi:hypothetical protein